MVGAGLHYGCKAETCEPFDPRYFDLKKSGASDRCGWMLRRDDGLEPLG
jgi:hypothetical protein